MAVANSLRTPGAITPFGEVDAQLSDGNSSYNALNLEVKRRFSNNFQVLASYTWSHRLTIPRPAGRFSSRRIIVTSA